MKKPHSEAAYRQAAKRMFHDEGTLEVDENAVVSQAEGNEDEGAYVQAWVWVRDEDVPSPRPHRHRWTEVTTPQNVGAEYRYECRCGATKYVVVDQGEMTTTITAG